MKKNNYNERINNIYSKRETMQNLIKGDLLNSLNNLIFNINDIELSLMFDNKNIKDYKNIIYSKEMINSLTMLLSNTINEEEAIKTRNRINYYIKKIKHIINENNIDEYTQNIFTNCISKLRKNASKQIRFVKRIDKLNEINNLNNNYNNLSIEDKNKLKKYLKNENDYNRRFIKNNTIKSTNKIESIKVYDKYDLYHKLLKDEEEQKPEKINTTNENIKKKIQPLNEIEKGVDELEYNIRKYKNYYKIKNIEKYNKTKIEKIFTLLKNMPKYLWNKRVIKQMKIDFNAFLLNEDLIAFIEYNKRRNSVKFALNYIFNKDNSILNEGEYLYDYNMCKNWINDYFYRNENINELKLIK